MEGQPPKKIFKAAVINTDELLKEQARDIGDARMTESKEDRSANWFVRTGKRIWKHNLAQEWYRQREILRAKKEILEKQNLYAGETGFDPDKVDTKVAHEEAMGAIVSRFTSEYEEEMLKEEEQDSKKEVMGEQVNTELKQLIKKYAGSSMAKDAFEEEKNRILSRYDQSLANKKSMYADNIFQIANEVRDSVSHGMKLNEFDFDVELTLGNARSSLSTEAHQTGFDATVEKMQNSQLGRYIANEPVALMAAAGLYAGVTKLSQTLARSKIFQWGTFGAGALLSGGISAVKESARLERERAQDTRERAKGMQFKEADMKRRKEMGESTYEMMGATDIIQYLGEDLEKIESGDVTEEEANAIMGRLADLESRVKLNDQKKIDLISYDKFNTVEKDRMEMDLKRAELKVALRRGISANKIKLNTTEDFDTYLSLMTDTQKAQLLGGERGIEKKDEIFNKMKKKKVAKAFIYSTLASATFGVAFQELRALGNPSQDGIIEGSIKSIRNHLSSGGSKDFLEDNVAPLDKNATALEYLRRSIMGESARMPHDDLANPYELRNMVTGIPSQVYLPKGVELVQNPSDGTFNIIRGGEVVGSHIPLNVDTNGNLSLESYKALARNDIYNDFVLEGGKTTETIHETAEDYIKNHSELTHKVHRELFYDNDSPHPFDQNELGLEWGGVNNTGLDANGNYVFNMSHMNPDGSYHAGMYVDAQGAMHEGKLKMLLSLSRGTQHQVFEVPIDPSTGNAIIDPNSPVGKMMFENHNGHAVFTGQFAEVAEARGLAPDGGENVRILATHIGAGREMIDDTINIDTTTPKIILDIPEKSDYEVPFPIPIRPRRPLERGEYEKNKIIEANKPKKFIEAEDGKDFVRGVHFEEIPKSALKFGPAPKGKKGVRPSFLFTQDKGFVGNDAKIEKNTGYIKGVFGLNMKSIKSQIGAAQKYNRSEVVIFEDSQDNRAENHTNLAILKKKYPKVKFTYAQLPENIKKVNAIGAREYMDRRIKNIIKVSDNNKRPKYDLFTGKALKTKKVIKIAPLGDISDAEWNRFVDKDEVSDPRLKDIAEKIKKSVVLTSKELAIRADKSEIIERLLKKIK